MIEMTRDEFWAVVEQCRARAADMREFNRRLEAALDDWELPKLAAFHKAMWFDVGVYHEDEFREVVQRAADYLQSDNSWDSYGGWLIAQGREFHEAALRDPRLALARLPPPDDVWEGESVIFVAQRVCFRRTGQMWSLYDLFGHDLDGTPSPGVDFPVTGGPGSA
jgi:Protein of unknown function (DUF4240)